MRRKALLVGLAALAFSVGAWICLLPSYHEWRMNIAADDIQRQRSNRYSLTEDIMGLLRGEPLTYSDYAACVFEHQEALVRIGYFQRREILLPGPVTDFDRQDEFVGRAMQRISKYAPWSVSFSTGATSIVVTDTPQRLKKWEQIVREMDVPQNNRTAVRPANKPRS